MLQTAIPIRNRRASQPEPPPRCNSARRAMASHTPSAALDDIRAAPAPAAAPDPGLSADALELDAGALELAWDEGELLPRAGDNALLALLRALPLQGPALPELGAPRARGEPGEPPWQGARVLELAELVVGAGGEMAEHPDLCFDVDPDMEARASPVLKWEVMSGLPCTIALYMVYLSRTILLNVSIREEARMAFLLPQLRFGFSAPACGAPLRHKNACSLPARDLMDASDFYRACFSISPDQPFKHFKEAVLHAINDAWVSRDWTPIINALHCDFDYPHRKLVDATRFLAKDGQGTPAHVLVHKNCHRHAPDILADLAGAESALNSLRAVATKHHVSLDTVSNARWQSDIYPAWYGSCAYVRQHSVPDCCSFYRQGYHKAALLHINLYAEPIRSGRRRARHVVKTLKNFMKCKSMSDFCIRAVKCAAGLRLNVDKSFIGSAKQFYINEFMGSAPRVYEYLRELEERLARHISDTAIVKKESSPACGSFMFQAQQRAQFALHRARELPACLSLDFVHNAKKHRRQPAEVSASGADADGVCQMAQNIQHAKAANERKKVNLKTAQAFLSGVLEDVQSLKELRSELGMHGEECDCAHVHVPTDMSSIPLSSGTVAA